MANPLYIAVDLGAGSGRVFIGGVGEGELLLEEIHRFRYPPGKRDGHLRWDFAAIFENIKNGLRKASARAFEMDRPVLTLGVDGWGVDYGLLNSNGELLADPVCYRDDRTRDAMAVAFETVDRSEIFRRTGIQFLNFNTLFQLISEESDLSMVDKLLLLPDLINFFLTGRAVAEFTNATTTQMVDSGTGDWDREMLNRFRIPDSILCEIVPAGANLGKLRPELAANLSLNDVTVISPATHDTGSAIAAAPLSENWAYISSGTWSLIGIERTSPLINEEVAAQNFTNEGGAFGTTRFLKNVMGLWILECCRKEWDAAGLDTDYDSLIDEASLEDQVGPLIYPDDKRLLNPQSMLATLERQLSETGQTMPNRPGMIAKMILDSLAFRYASVLRTIESLNGISLEGIQILGGGGRNRYLNQMTADASSLTVKAGLTEATVLGNILVQAVASGRFSSLIEARQHVSDNFTFEEFVPDESRDLTNAARLYFEVESRFSSAV